MARLNHHYTKLSPSHLSEKEFRMGTLRQEGKTTLTDLSLERSSQPLPKTILSSLITASQTMGESIDIGPAQGHLFLREAIAAQDYKNHISAEEIFISDGVQGDMANIQEIFALESRIAVPNPSHPTYVEANVMAGRTRLPLKTGGYGGVLYLSCTEKNRFCPEVPNRPADLLYLCSPSNVTGVAMNRQSLETMVHYAKAQGAVILFDSTYQAYISSPDVPRSIYEIEGAKDVAIELRDFPSLRISYLVIPKSLTIVESFHEYSLLELWKKRTETKFSAVSYPLQKSAAAFYTKEGKKEMAERVADHLAKAKLLRDGLRERGYTVFGGENSPYLWLKIPSSYSSLSYTQKLLETFQIAAIAGSAFGTEGEGYVRLSSFASASHIVEGLKRIPPL